MGQFVYLFILWAAIVQTSSAYSRKNLFYVDQSAGEVQQIQSIPTPFSSWSSPVAISDYTLGASSQVSAVGAFNALHVFYQDNYGNIIVQPSPSGTSWNPGQVIVNSTVVGVTTGTALAAAFYPGSSSDIQCYFQDNTNLIRQVAHSSSGWAVTRTTTFSEPAIANSPISTIEWNTNEIRVYYVGTNGDIYQVSHTSSGWSSPTSISNAGTFTALGSVYYFSHQSNNDYEVFFVDTLDYALHGLIYDSGWETPSPIYSASTIPGGISAVYDNSTYTYAYFQDASNTIIELYLSSGTYSTGPLSQSVSAPTYITGAVY